MVPDSRHVAFEACFNFRDIGGYEAVDRRRVRWGAVFRSGSLHRLSEADREIIARLGVRTVVDLRAAIELDRDGHFGNHGDVRLHHVPFEDDSSATTDEFNELPPSLGEIYVTMAHVAQDAIAAALRIIAEGEHPVVIHCHAGKDRTGIIAALLLSSLGVPDATIADDYQLSEDAIAPSIEWAQRNDPGWAAHMDGLPPWVLRAPPDAMAVFLGAIRDRYGSVDDYLVRVGLDQSLLDVLHARLLT